MWVRRRMLKHPFFFVCPSMVRVNAQRIATKPIHFHVFQYIQYMAYRMEDFSIRIYLIHTS